MLLCANIMLNVTDILEKKWHGPALRLPLFSQGIEAVRRLSCTGSWKLLVWLGAPCAIVKQVESVFRCDWCTGIHPERLWAGNSVQMPLSLVHHGRERNTLRFPIFLQRSLPPPRLFWESSGVIIGTHFQQWLAHRDLREKWVTGAKKRMMGRKSHTGTGFAQY